MMKALDVVRQFDAMGSTALDSEMTNALMPVIDNVELLLEALTVFADVTAALDNAVLHGNHAMTTEDRRVRAALVERAQGLIAKLQ